MRRTHDQSLQQAIRSLEFSSLVCICVLVLLLAGLPLFVRGDGLVVTTQANAHGSGGGGCGGAGGAGGGSGGGSGGGPVAELAAAVVEVLASCRH